LDSHVCLAHTAAYFDAHILHRDISVGDILITDEGGGLLIDWDLSVVVDDSEQQDRHVSSGRYVDSVVFLLAIHVSGTCP